MSHWNYNSKSFWKQGLGLFIIISIFVHCTSLVYWHFVSELEESHVPEKTMEITQLTPEQLRELEAPPVRQEKKVTPPPASKQKQIAETEDAKNREIDPNADFLGEHNQKVSEEKRAEMTDDFREKTGTGSNKEKTQEPPAMPPTGSLAGVEASPEGALPGGETKDEKAGVKRDWKSLSLKDLSLGDGGSLAATDDYMPHVQSGDQTLVSTREFKFYSYYHRIKELLRQYWKPNIEQKIARMWGLGRNISSDELITHVQVLLDRQGRIQKISRTGSCGVVEIDEAAVQAFHRAAPFPNPPHGMVDSDGFVRINWDFILRTESGPRIQFRTAGKPGHPNY